MARTSKTRSGDPRKRRSRRLETNRLEDRLLLSRLVVNSTSDVVAKDLNLTLREAIEVVNRTLPVTDMSAAERASITGSLSDRAPPTIAFAIPGNGVRTITVLEPLPATRYPVVIDGYTQSGTAPATDTTPAVLLVDLNGIGAAPGTSGLTIEGGGSTVRGLVVSGFRGTAGGEGGFGIVLGERGGNLVEGCFVGTDEAGTAPRANTSGIGLFSPNNTIGGGSAASRNVLSGNSYNGIQVGGLHGTGPTDATGNVIVGNYIGTNALGTGRLGNDNGIRFFEGGGGCTVGGSQPGLRNVVSGNRFQGILMDAESPGSNMILGNLVGTDTSGKVRLSNDAEGIEIHAPGNFVGLPLPGNGNLISGNKGSGVFIVGEAAKGNTVAGNRIGTDADGTGRLGNDIDGVQIKGATKNLVDENVISANGYTGVSVFDAGATGNEVRGNRIGTDATGTTDLGNDIAGVWIEGASGNLVGGDTLLPSGHEPRNVISANGFFGVVLNAGAHHNRLVDNYIGVDVTGAAPTKVSQVSNTFDGVLINGSPSNELVRNVISGNGRNGVAIQDEGADHNLITGRNYIGVNATASAEVPNGGHGVLIQDGAGNRIDCESFQDGNIIAGNLGDGVHIAGPKARDNIVSGNLIGTDTLGILPLGNKGSGIVIDGAPGNFVGVSGGPGNVISANTLHGIWVKNAKDTIVQANLVGTNVFGNAPMGNGQVGIYLDHAEAARVGGATTGAGNIVSAHKTQGGILIEGGKDNEVLGNGIGTDAARDKVVGAQGYGIKVSGANSTGIGLTGFGNIVSGNKVGIRVDTGSYFTNIIGNTIGGGAGGNVRRPNLGNGVEVDDSRKTSILSDVIVANTGHGIYVSGATTDELNVSGCFIGTNESGSGGLGNNCGIVILGASRCHIGANVSAPNVISGNNGYGIWILQGAKDNTVVNCLIGSNPGGTAPLGNTLDGVFLDEVSGNTVGGIAPQDGNLIAAHAGEAGVSISGGGGNHVLGNKIGTDLGGESRLGHQDVGVKIADSPNNTVGDVGADNIISGNERDGILITGQASTGNMIRSNVIGPRVNIQDPLLNLTTTTQANGLHIVGAPGNTIGGTFSQGNLVSGNTGRGILIEGQSAKANQVTGNIVGTDYGMTRTLENGGSGVVIDGARDTAIGTAETGNVISGNEGYGIWIKGGATGTSVLSNRIGTNAHGDQPLGNNLTGVFLDNVKTNTIGGPGGGNLISANSTGVMILDGGENQVLNNGIGTDTTRTQALGSQLDGLVISGSRDNRVMGNVISGNRGYGVRLVGLGALGNLFGGNDIGTQKDHASPLGNAQDGLLIEQGASRNLIGLSNGRGNTIAFNGGAGVTVTSGTGNEVRFNSIFENIGLGIDLAGDGVTPNDPGDADTGPNDLMNYPVLYSATSGIEVLGRLRSQAGATFLVDFYGAGEDPSGYGEGKLYMGSTAVTTDATGVGSFSTKLPGWTSAPGAWVTATATDVVTGSTSEFSLGIRVQADRDDDGVSDATEDKGPNGGDANKDGIPDSQQANVATFLYQATGAYLSLVAPIATALKDVASVVAPNPPPGVSFPFGNISFNLEGLSIGESIVLQLLVSVAMNPQTYMQYGPTPALPISHWYDFNYNGTTGAEIQPGVINLHYVDGELGDHDLMANGVISDPGGPVVFLAAGLSLSGDQPTATVVAGQPLTATFSAANTAATNATDVVLTDVLPAGVRFVSASVPAGATVSEQGGVVTLTLGTLAAGTRVDVAVTVVPTRSGSLVQQAHVGGTLAGDDPGDNDVSLTTAVEPLPAIVVNAADDADDGVNDGAHTTLREAIRLANAMPGIQQIVFAITAAGPIVLRPGSPLPAITDPTVIDAETQPGYAGTPLILLDGRGAGPANGLVIDTSDTTLRGLAIGGFATEGGLDTGNGVVIASGTGNAVEACYLGTDTSGTTVLVNAGAGVLLLGGSGHMVGGDSAGAGNLLSGNQYWGVLIGHDSSSNTVAGNRIGTTADGLTALGNLGPGVEVGSGDNLVANNVISANSSGVLIRSADENAVQGNLIGLAADGRTLLGNSATGVMVFFGAKNVIGGTATGEANTISGNAGAGVMIAGSGWVGGVGNQVLGNRIGTAADGTTAVGNGGSGVMVGFSGSSNAIGGVGAGEGNVIAFNGRDGVTIDTSSTGTSVRGNAIHDNARLGIDLGGNGVTPNDPGDLDIVVATGINPLLNFPVLTGASSGSLGTLVRGTVDGPTVDLPFWGITAGKLTLDFYACPAADPSGYGEGQLYLGSTTVVNRGTVSFAAELPGVVPADWVVTSTATDWNGNTSEFSAPITAVLDTDHDGVLDSVEDAAPGGGDGNGDGIPDRLQGDVASLPDAVDGAYVTLVADSTALLREVRAVPNPSPADLVSGVSFPVGLFEFRFLRGGGAVTILTPAGVTVDTAYAYGPDHVNPTDHWYQFRFDGLTGLEVVAGRAVVHLADNQRGDDDLSWNSEVLTRFGPATTGPEAGSVLAVTNTNDTGPGSLRQAINDANLLPGRDVIRFAIPASDPGHVYYRNDGVAGQVSADSVTATTASSDGDIADIDPDYPHSWWRIQPTATNNPIHPEITRIALPWLTDSAVIDATTQPGWLPATATTPAILRIEIDGTSSGRRVEGLRLTGGNSLVRGLSIHGFYSDDFYGGALIHVGNEWGYRVPGGNVIEGNHLGTDVSGTLSSVPLSRYWSQRYGVLIANSDDNTIGGTTPAARNVISGLDYYGVHIFSDVTGDSVVGNFIGTDATGSRALPNGFGISIVGGNVQIGGDYPGARNVISGNDGYGVDIVSEAGARTGNQVQGNFIGSDLTGSVALPNRQGGVILVAAVSTLVGGITPGSGNLISGNGGPGISIVPGELSLGPNTVQGNLIGTDVSGTQALGNAGDGIRITQTSDNLVGGTEPSAGNLIAYNAGAGVVVMGGDTSAFEAKHDVIEGNRIFDNGGIGIDLEGDGVTHNDPGAGRSVVPPQVLSASLVQSGMHAEVQGTIQAEPSSDVTVSIKVAEFEGWFDVAVVTDGAGLGSFSYGLDDGPLTLERVWATYPWTLNWANEHRTFPVITSVVTGADTTISGTLDSIASTTFHLEFFASASADASGYGEGETLLGTAEVTTDADGQAAFTVTFPTSVSYGHVITATATDPEDNTSEFSAAFTVTPPPDRLDFGDAPDPTYPTLLGSDGARHVIVPGVQLGATVSAEPDGQAGTDDDGVAFLTPLVAGQAAAIRVNASINGRLDAWIDWNADGDWSDPGEAVFTNEPLVAGDNTLFVGVPASAPVTDRGFARFRFSTAGGLAPTGLAADGEVEDYGVAIVAEGSPNGPPVAADDTAVTPANTSLVLDVTVNDSDPDGNLDRTSVRLLTVPSHGTAAVDPATGLVSYTADAGFMGTDVFTYDVADTAGLRGQASVSVVVGTPNARPVARDDAATTDEGRPVLVAVLANDSDPDGDVLGLVAVDTAGAHGTVDVDPSGVLVYTPEPAFRGTSVFAYTVGDGHGATATARATVTVAPVNQPPAAADDTASTPGGRAVVIDVAANDTDVDGNLDARSVTVSLAPQHGTAVVDPTTGLVTYTPASGFDGADTFDYEIADASGLLGAASVTVVVTRTGHAPTARPDAARTPEGVPVAVAVLANDTDAGGDLDPGTVRVAEPPAHGWAEVDPVSGVVTYAPMPGFRGADALVYEVRDAAGSASQGAVILTVDPVPAPPVAADDTASTDARVPVVVDLLANDTVADSPLVPGTVHIVAGPGRGAVSVDPVSGAAAYTPAPGFTGTDRFAYEVADSLGATSRAVVSVSVRGSGVNTPPTAVDDTFMAFEGTALTVVVPGLLANDGDPDGDLLTVIPGAGPRHGQLTVSDDGSFQYGPEAGFVGTDTFTYRVSDGQAPSDFATVTVTVAARSLLAFESPAYRVAESGGQAVVTLVRTGTLSNPVSVRVRTQGGTATAGVDYRVVDTVVTFEPGQSRRTVAIPVLDDRLVEGDETVGLVLSEPSAGATLGTMNAATLTVTDDDVNPPDDTGPSVVSVQRYGIHWQPTRVVLTFNEALDPVRATDLRNYRVVSPGCDGRLGTRDDQFVRIVSAVYDPSRHTVTFTPAQPLNFHKVYYLAVDGMSTRAVTDLSGNTLDGDVNGRPGGHFVTAFHGVGAQTKWQRHVPAGPRALATRWFSTSAPRTPRSAPLGLRHARIEAVRVPSGMSRKRLARLPVAGSDQSASSYAAD